MVEEGIKEKGAVVGVKTGEKFPCKMCAKPFKTKSRLRMHIQSCHDIAEDCDVCGKTFSSRKYMRRHKREVHTERSFMCSKCPLGFKSRGVLQVHTKTCGRWRDKKKQQLKVKCAICPELLPSNPCLKKHMWKHHHILLHNPAPSLRRRRQLLFASRRPRNWMCAVSSTGFSRKEGPVAHSRMHQFDVQEQQMELLVCGFQGCTFMSRSKTGLIKHKLDAHKGERAFSCDMCDHTCATNKDLLQHRCRMHKRLAIKCRGEDGVSGCGKLFRRKDNLRRHLRACGAPLHKPWLSLGPSQKARRIKEKASKFRTELDSMEKDERKAYIRAVVKNNPDFLDSQTTNPFTTEDVIEVRTTAFCVKKLLMPIPVLGSIQSRSIC